MGLLDIMCFLILYRRKFMEYLLSIFFVKNKNKNDQNYINFLYLYIDGMRDKKINEKKLRKILVVFKI